MPLSRAIPAQSATATRATTRRRVGRSARRMATAKSRATALSDRVSDRTDEFHKVTGSVLANANTAKQATALRSPWGTARPTVRTRKPQESAAITVWATTKVVGDPVTFHRNGTSGGRWPNQKPALHTGSEPTCS